MCSLYRVEELFRAGAYLFVMVVATVSFAWAQADGEAAPAAVAPMPAQEGAAEGARGKMEVPEPMYDFGQITSATAVSHRFKVCNTGEGPLTITGVQAGCGCTATNVGKNQLAPGECTEVEATFNPGRFRNKVTKTVTVNSDDPVNPSVTLTFSADIIDPLMAEPDFVRFDNVMVGTSPQQSVIIKAATAATFNITNLECQPPRFRAEVDTSTQLPEGQKQVLVTLDNAESKENLNGTLVIHTDHPEQPRLEVRLWASVTGRVEFDPGRLFIPAVAGSPTVKVVKVRSKVEMPEFQVTGVSLELEDAEAEITGQEDGWTIITVKLTPPADASTTYRQGRLIAHTNVPGEEMADMPITVSVRPNITAGP